eukprot:11206684-Lingulodinium_polyedra.AAC.1
MLTLVVARAMRRHPRRGANARRQAGRFVLWMLPTRSQFAPRCFTWTPPLFLATMARQFASAPGRSDEA